MTNQMIPAEAVEAAAKAAYIAHSNEPGFNAEAAWNDMSGTEDWEHGQWESIARAALEAAAPYMSSLSVSSLSAEEIEAVEVMIKTAKANGWNEGYAAGMDRQVPEPRA